MKTQGRSWKERICALLLALAMVLTGMLPGSTATAEAAMPWEKEIEVTFKITDSDGNIFDEALIKVKENSLQEEVLELIKQNDKLFSYIESGIKKVIFVKNKIINIIV